MKKIILICGFIACALHVQAQSFVASVSPSQNSFNVRPSANIILSFSADINPATLTASTVKVSGSLSGPHILKSLAYTGATRSAVIDPAADFSAGELVTVVVTPRVQNIVGDAMPVSFTSQFSVASKVGSGVLTQTGIPGTGNQPWAAATIDANHDGAFDFLVLNRTSKTVSVLRNYGGGNFLQTASANVGAQPSSFAVADLNGDDIADCAVANEGSNTVTLLFLDAAGAFVRSASIDAPGAPSAVLAADIDGDGDADLLVAGRSSNTVTIFKNDGSGTYSAGAVLNVGAAPSALASGDFNADGAIDYAVASESANTVTVFLNNGKGSFTAQTPVRVAAGPVALSTADFDNDGAMDLAVASKTSNTISVLRNDGAGIFYIAAVLTSLAAPSAVASGDMDGDGICDLAGLGSGVTVFRNQGYFQFTALGQASGGTSPHGLLLADLDGDGDLDGAVCNSASSSLSILTNRPAVSASVVPSVIDFGVGRSGRARQLSVSIHNDGVLVPLKIMSVASSNPSVFSSETPSALIAPMDSVAMTVTFTPADVKNYSDSLTLVTNDPVRPTVKIYLRAVGGLVVLSTWPAPGSAVSDPMAPATASFNGTLEAASLRTSTVKLYGEMSGLHTLQYTNGDRQMTAAPVQRFLTGERVTAVLTDSLMAQTSLIRLLDGYVWNYTIAPALGSEFYTAGGQYASGASPYAVGVGDFNGDGYADLASANSGDNTVSVFMNDTHGGLMPAVVYSVGVLPQALLVADLNEDGAPDIAAVNTVGNTITILLNRKAGDGSLALPALVVAAGSEPRAIASGDFNNDGHLDLAVSNAKDNTVSIFTNDGAAHFSPFKTIAVGQSPRALAAADFNNDGTCDLAVMNRQASTITILLNARSGAFTSFTVASGASPTALAAADIDQDGYPDLVTANTGSKDLTILLNDKSGAFRPGPAVPMYNTPTALYAGDLSGDGMIDLAAAQYSSASEISTVQVLVNLGADNFRRGDSVVVNSPVAVAGFDLNNRGILHLASANLLSNRITLINPAAAQTPMLVSPVHESVSLKPPLVLAWQTTARTIRYHVQVADSATGVLVVDDTSAVLREYPIVSLGYSRTYQWRVRAKNDIGWGEFSSWWNFGTCIAPPPAPVLALPSEGQTDESRVPRFAWLQAPTAESYRLQASEDPLFSAVIADTTLRDTVWQSPALKIHTTYYWRVSASNYGGESPWSDTRSFTTLLPVPEPVVLASPVNNARPGTASVSFTWRTTPYEVKKYWFEIAADTLFIFRIVDSSVAETSWTMPKLSGNQRYFWKVRAFNEKGWGPFSETYTFSLGATSVEQSGRIPDHFTLEQNFPNPFNPTTTIRLAVPQASTVRVSIYDLLGREVSVLVNEPMAPGVYDVTWNAQGMPSGIYFCRMTAGTFTALKKLTLQK
ncbi:MAG: FG-GAP-like repeat-containing protein [Acidobacteriota bacterium]